MDELTDTVAVVTGSNTGIGRAAAASLAGRGATVVLACRSEEKTRPVIEEMVAASGNPRIEFSDWTWATWRRCARPQPPCWSRHVRSTCSSTTPAWPANRGMTTSGFEMTFGVNHVGHFLFTTALLERVVESGPSRIVNVSSGNHFNAKGIDFDAVRRPTKTFIGLKEYDVSKLANVLFTKSLVERLDPDKASVFSVNPGPVATDIWRRMPGPMYALYRRVARLRSVEDGAQPTLHAATAPGIEAITGTYFDQDCQPKEVSRTATRALAEELWDKSVAWVAEDAAPS